MKYRCPNCGRRRQTCTPGRCFDDKTNPYAWFVHDGGRPLDYPLELWEDYQAGKLTGALFFMADSKVNHYWKST